MTTRRGPIPHGGRGHEWDDAGVCHLCDADNRRRAASYRDRKRDSGWLLRCGYWYPPAPADDPPQVDVRRRAE